LVTALKEGNLNSPIFEKPAAEKGGFTQVRSQTGKAKDYLDNQPTASEESWFSYLLSHPAAPHSVLQRVPGDF
jgi:hypothetical protein